MKTYIQYIRRGLALVASLACMIACYAQQSDSLIYSVSILTNASTGRLAPYMIGSWNHDRTSMKNGYNVDFFTEKPLNLNGRIGWGAGVEILAGSQHSAMYDKYDPHNFDWYTSDMKRAHVSLRSFYASMRYRRVFILAGMKNFDSKIVDGSLSSGDLLRSNNARAIPGLTFGFVDFQDIPFTNGWLQIDGQIMYGKFIDNSFRRQQFNFYSDLLATDLYYTYKYCYFRTKPSQRLSVIFGMQAAGVFGGNTTYYRRGQLVRTDHRGFRFVDIFKMFFPTPDNGNGYYEGNSLGTWSLRARYNLPGGNVIAAYWEKFFEDGSGIGCRNGADGLYGLQFSFGKKGWVNKIVAEYLDFRNQSGPLHYAPGDHINPSITTEATGGDNYYNNDSFGPYSYFGMAIGSPMVMSPIYNENGFPQFIYNRMQGAHLAVSGSPAANLTYKLMGGWQKGYAMGRIPLPEARETWSAMAEVDWDARKWLPGFSFDCRLALDRGKLRGDNFGFALAIRYSGNLNINY